MRGRAPALLFGLLHPTRSTSAASPWCLQGRSLAAAADSTRLPATARLTPGNAFSLTKCFSAQDVAGFTGLTGDSNPIHSDAGAAAAAGLPAPILPGMLLASLFPAIIGSHFPGAIYLSQTLNFKQYALVGETFTASVIVERSSGSRVSFGTMCRHDSTGAVVVEGTALALIQQPHDRGVAGRQS